MQSLSVSSSDWYWQLCDIWEDFGASSIPWVLPLVVFWPWSIYLFLAKLSLLLLLTRELSAFKFEMCVCALRTIEEMDRVCADAPWALCHCHLVRGINRSGYDVQEPRSDSSNHRRMAITVTVFFFVDSSTDGYRAVFLRCLTNELSLFRTTCFACYYILHGIDNENCRLANMYYIMDNQWTSNYYSDLVVQKERRCIRIIRVLLYFKFVKSSKKNRVAVLVGV